MASGGGGPNGADVNGPDCAGQGRTRPRTRTAGVIIVGDEVLNGSVADSNSHFLSQRLHRLGVRLLKVSVVPDDVDTIATEVAEFSGRFDVVVVSGGVGPTHDDKTYAAVARAFRVPLVFDERVAEMVVKHHGGSLLDKTQEQNPALKMALVPANCRLHRVRDTEGTTITKPIIQVHNVYMFPGSPVNLERGFTQLEDDIRGDCDNKFHSRGIYLNVTEAVIVQPLNLVVEKFKDSVVFGSYPNCGNWDFETKLTLESSCWGAAQQAAGELLGHLHPGWVVGVSAPSMDDFAELIERSEDAGFRTALQDSLKILNECCDRYKPEELSLCFNGGKDATVLLHLACAVVRHRFPDTRGAPIQAFWVHSANPFPEVQTFVARMTKQYNLQLEEFPGPIKVALGTYLAGKPNVKAALLGTRRTDPFSSDLSAFQVTDSGWPVVIRVSPILDWSYRHVWTFLRELRLPYCALYDQG